MFWLLTRLGGAFLTGVGLKLGAEAYELIKLRVQQHRQYASDDADVAPAYMDAVVIEEVVEAPDPH